MDSKSAGLLIATLLRSVLVLGLTLTPTHAQVQAKVLDTVKIAQCHYYGFVPNVFHLSSGELLTMMKLDDDRHDVEGTLLGFQLSKDGGKTWGIRRTLGMIYREAAFTRLPARPDGSLFMVGGNALPADLRPLDPTGKRWGGENFSTLQYTSVLVSDHGEQFRISRDVTVRLPRPSMRQLVEDDVFNFARLGPGKVSELGFVLFHGNIVPADDGGLLATMYGKFVNDKFFRSLIVKSLDGGKTWDYLSTIADDKDAVLLEGEAKSLRGNFQRAGRVASTEGFPEPWMVRLRDGRLFVVMRRGHNNFMFKSWSSDDGKTWTKPESIGFRGVNPAVWLMSNGLLALCTGRPDPVSVYFSKDGGASWSPPTVVYDGRSSQNNDLIEVEPNKLLVVYDHIPVDWGVIPESQPRRQGGGPDWEPTFMNVIYGTFLEVGPGSGRH